MSSSNSKAFRYLSAAKDLTFNGSDKDEISCGNWNGIEKKLARHFNNKYTACYMLQIGIIRLDPNMGRPGGRFISNTSMIVKEK